MNLSQEPVAELRREYSLRGLRRADLDADPMRQFARWFDEAIAAATMDANCLTLATVGSDGAPSARMVLLKGYDQRGFIFFTNYESAKARQLEANPKAALVFYWAELERQICVAGSVEKTAREESENYFHSRPRGSQLGALASAQSAVVENRAELEQRLATVSEKYRDVEVPIPEQWGGYCLAPRTIEFWQGRPNRLHDRFRYTRATDGDWRIERLAP